MKTTSGFVKSRTIAGLLVLIPAILIVLLFIETVQLVLLIATPVAELLPVDEIGGIDVGVLLALTLIVVTLVVVGAIAQSRLGTALGTWLEDRVLARIPGYAVLKTLTTGLTGVDPTKLRPVMAEISQGVEEIGFVVEEHGAGAAVFFPLAPTPTIGSVKFVQADRLRALDVSTGTAMNWIMQFGFESKGIERTPPSAP